MCDEKDKTRMVTKSLAKRKWKNENKLVHAMIYMCGVCMCNVCLESRLIVHHVSFWSCNITPIKQNALPFIRINLLLISNELSHLNSLS